MKVTLKEKKTVERRKTAKAAMESAKAKGNPTNKEIVTLLEQILMMVDEIHEKVVG